jgi:hypothetical protein
MKVFDQQVCLWLTLIFGIAMLAAFSAFPGFNSPLSPTMSAAEVASYFADHLSTIRSSMVLFNLTDVMFVALFSVICIQMKRMAVPSETLAYAYLCCGASVAMLFALSDLFWLIAAFRPNRNPELIALLNDLAWVTFSAPIGLFCAQCCFLSINIFLDRNRPSVFPRWVAYFNFLVAAVSAPAALSAAKLDGPLAWNGSFSFGVRWSMFAIYVVVMLLVVQHAIKDQRRVQDRKGQ